MNALHLKRSASTVSMAAVFATTTLFTAGLHAQEGGNAEATTAPEADPAKPKMSLSVAPPPPPLQRKAYVHEGFYFRMNVGPGWMYTGINANDETGTSVEGHAFALGTDLLIGGSPSPGMALGGGVLTNLGFSADFKEDGVSRGTGTVFNFLAGPFFDAFPNDKDGWHLGTMVGFMGMTQTSSIADITDTGWGGGGGAWGGYDMWVAPEWSAGFQIRATGGYMVGTDSGVGIFSAVGLITILNH